MRSAVQDSIAAGENTVTGVVPCEGRRPGRDDRAVASAPAVSEAGTVHGWSDPSRSIPMTDDRGHSSLLVAASGAVWCGQDPYTLTIACAGGSTELTVTWQLGSRARALIDVGLVWGMARSRRSPGSMPGRATTMAEPTRPSSSRSSARRDRPPSPAARGGTGRPRSSTSPASRTPWPTCARPAAGSSFWHAPRREAAAVRTRSTAALPFAT